MSPTMPDVVIRHVMHKIKDIFDAILQFGAAACVSPLFMSPNNMF